MSHIEYIVVATSKVGKVEDLAVCNAYSLARDYAEQFASSAPHDALVTIYEGKQIAVYSGKIGLEASIEQGDLSDSLRGHAVVLTESWKDF